MISHQFHRLLLKRTWQAIFLLLAIHGSVILIYAMGVVGLSAVFGNLAALGVNLFIFGFERIVQGASLLFHYPDEKTEPDFKTYLEGKALSLGHEQAFLRCYFHGMIHNIKGYGDIDDDDIAAFKSMMMKNKHPSLLAPFSYTASLDATQMSAHDKMEKMRYFHAAKASAQDDLTAQVPWILSALCKVFPNRYG